jgi:hypothetical protein
MIQLLDSGWSVETLLELIACDLRPCRVRQDTGRIILSDDVISPVPDRPLPRTSSFQFFYLPPYQFTELCNPTNWKLNGSEFASPPYNFETLPFVLLAG